MSLNSWQLQHLKVHQATQIEDKISKLMYVRIHLEIQHSPDLRYHCVLKKPSVCRNSIARGLFFIVNVLGFFKIALWRGNGRTQRLYHVKVANCQKVVEKLPK